MRFGLAIVMTGAAFALGACNQSAGPPQVAAQAPMAQAPAAEVQPSPAQVAARNAWLGCLDRAYGRYAAAAGPSAGADRALVECGREERVMAARIAQDPTITPTQARAGLDRVKSDWKRERMARG